MIGISVLLAYTWVSVDDDFVLRSHVDIQSLYLFTFDLADIKYTL